MPKNIFVENVEELEVREFEAAVEEAKEGISTIEDAQKTLDEIINTFTQEAQINARKEFVSLNEASLKNELEQMKAVQQSVDLGADPSIVQSIRTPYCDVLLGDKATTQLKEKIKKLEGELGQTRDTMQKSKSVLQSSKETLSKMLPSMKKGFISTKNYFKAKVSKSNIEAQRPIVKSAGVITRKWEQVKSFIEPIKDKATYPIDAVKRARESFSELRHEAQITRDIKDLQADKEAARGEIVASLMMYNKLQQKRDKLEHKVDRIAKRNEFRERIGRKIAGIDAIDEKAHAKNVAQVREQYKDKYKQLSLDECTYIKNIFANKEFCTNLTKRQVEIAKAYKDADKRENEHSFDTINNKVKQSSQLEGFFGQRIPGFDKPIFVKSLKKQFDKLEDTQIDYSKCDFTMSQMYGLKFALEAHMEPETLKEMVEQNLPGEEIMTKALVHNTPELSDLTNSELLKRLDDLEYNINNVVLPDIQYNIAQNMEIFEKMSNVPAEEFCILGEQIANKEEVKDILSDEKEAYAIFIDLNDINIDQYENIKAAYGNVANILPLDNSICVIATTPEHLAQISKDCAHANIPTRLEAAENDISKSGLEKAKDIINKSKEPLSNQRSVVFKGVRSISDDDAR